MVRTSAWRGEASDVSGRPGCWPPAPYGAARASAHGFGLQPAAGQFGPAGADADEWRLAGETDWIGIEPAPDALWIALCPPIPPDTAVPEAETPQPGGQTAKGSKTEKAPKRDQTDRAAETLFRVLYQHHEQLSVMADTKAHIMITLCAALAGIATTQLTDPLLHHTAVTVILACLLAAGFAVVAMPARAAQSVIMMWALVSAITLSCSWCW